LVEKIVQISICFKGFKIQTFLNLIVNPQTKLRGTKTGLICSGSTSELFNMTEKNKNSKRKQVQSTAWPRNNRTPNT
jgi:hypothetical protein